ncbi:MAG: thioredoxin family protein [Candidatus Reconcilbacillus cellulovorans]|uniref:Thioredoxin family protein n=1 Tax=Candidatus Reconcilbacillus cellulovorans TaxID=1906605 RepID=A0A2A6E0B1_9BACL|nr:MAG: thioredoxin family protein [Candidatus Reconcilbacillus cellulovorans]
MNVADKLGKGISPASFVERMTRNREAFEDWGRRFAWPSDDDRFFFERLRGRQDLRCLILAADWCGDVVRNVPVVFRVLETADLPTEVFIMEEHLDLMDRFLTMGGRSIPVVIFADASGAVLGRWGPRPQHVQEVMVRFKQENPDRDAPDYQEKLNEARREMARRYGEGTEYQAAIVRELRELIASFR